MEKEKPYIPSKAEMEKAEQIAVEGQMTPKEEEISEGRDATMKHMEEKNKQLILKHLKEHDGDRNILQDVPIELRNDKEFMLEVVKTYSAGLNYASNELKNDKDIVEAAMRKANEGGIDNYNDLFEMASDNLKCDKEFVKRMLEISPNALRHASKDLQEDKELIEMTREKWGK